MNGSLYFRIVLAILVIFSSCIDQIDFDVASVTTDSVVVEGRVIKGDPSFVEVAVSRLFDFSAESRLPIALKSVVLSDTNGNTMELETRSPGYYKVFLNDDTLIKAEVGTGYSIILELLDGRLYESEVEVLISTPDPLQLNVEIEEELIINEVGQVNSVEKVALTIDTNLDSETNNGLLWEVMNIFKITDSPIDDGIEMKTCYLTQNANVNNIHVLDPELLSSTVVERFPLTQALIGFRFSQGLFYEVRQYGLSQGAFAFWNRIDLLSEREGTMFDGPVGLVPTNLKNVNDPDDVVFGFFFASEEKLLRIRVPQELVGNLDPHCPPSGPPRAGPGGSCLWGVCCDCLSYPNSTTEVPAFWFD